MSIHCSRCSQELSAEAQFCLNCGTPVGAAPDNIALPDSGGTTAPPSAPEPASVWQPTPAQPPAPAPVGQPGPVGQAGWQADGPPAAGPPPAQPPYIDPVTGHVSTPPTDAHFVEATASSGGGAGRLVAIGLGVAGVLAVGFVALRFITGGSELAGGASSPEEVVEEMVAAINAQDPLAVLSLMAPDELDGLDDVVEEATTYMNDLGLNDVIDQQTEDTDIEIDIEADRIDVSMEGDNAAIVSFELSGDLRAQNSMMDDEFSFTSRDLEDALPNGSDEVDMIVVKLEGKWYASPMLTGAHYIVENNDLPRGDYDRIGGDRDPGASSAEDAIDALVDVINDPDADELAAILGGGEGRVALVFRDAIDEGFSNIETGDTRYELSVRTEDIGNGRVQLTELQLDIDDGYSSGTITIDDDCATLREDGERSERNCLLDQIDVDNERDIDTTLWLDTVQEDGSRRVRFVPTITDVMSRFIGVVDDRQTLLYEFDLQQFDTPTMVSAGNDVDIEFDGQLYAVNEFEIEEGESYNITTSDGAEFDLWVNDGSGLDQQYRTSFVADGDGVARVVTYSEFDFDNCDGFGGCVPSGEGDTTLRIREAARQSVPFPTVLSGDLGPGDSRIFELEVTTSETVTIAVDGVDVEWRILDDFDIWVEGDTYALTTGTYELVVSNRSGDDDTSYTVTPTAS